MSTTLRTMVVGGSNTVLGGGYFPSFVRACADLGLTLDVTANRAVGNTTIGYGLMALKREKDFRDIDLLIIEYAINDAFAYTSEALLRHWSRLYEGVIRAARERNPDVRIFTILFDSRTGEWAHKVPEIQSRAYYISTVYGTWFCDVQRELLRQYGTAPLDDETFYIENDAAHYRPPIATSVVARLLADSLVRQVHAHDARDRGFLLPVAIDKGHCGGASVIPLTRSAEVMGRPPETYQNSRFGCRAVDLAEKKLVLTLKGGILLGLEYVCEARTPELFIEIGSETIAVTTMKHGIRKGFYKFLLSYLPTEFLFQHAPGWNTGAEYTIKLSGRGTKTRTYTPRDGSPGAVSPPDGQSAVLPVGDLMHTGTLVGLHTEDADTDHAGNSLPALVAAGEIRPPAPSHPRPS
jgi:hypothetical protein